MRMGSRHFASNRERSMPRDFAKFFSSRCHVDCVGRSNGRVIKMMVPGGDDMQLHQPTHKLAYNL